MQERLSMLTATAFAFGLIRPFALTDAVANLPVLLAFDVLGQVLQQLRDEGRFRCKREQLGVLMDDAQTSLAWLDWPALRDGVRRRNEIAHDGKLFDRKQCWDDVRRIEQQLMAWGVLATPCAQV
jgi:hypothetical protein